MATVDEKIDGMVKEYIDLYEVLREGELRDQARSLAMHDSVILKYIAEKVIERVRAYIESRESG